MKDTKISTSAKYIFTEYPEGDVFKNTDETGYVEIMIRDNGCIWSLPISVFNILKDDLLDNNESLSIVPLPKEQNKVSEDFALKAMALVLNKEKFSDLK